MKVYIAGKITGNENYREEFEKAQAELEKDGHTVLNPAVLPEGLTKAEYMRICFAMIDIADEVRFLPGWQDSEGAKVEYTYCLYVGKKMLDLGLIRNAERAVDLVLEQNCFSKRLRRLRKNAGMNVNGFANKLNISKQAVIQYEQGKTNPCMPVIIKISKIFGVSADWLLGLDEEVEYEH